MYLFIQLTLKQHGLELHKALTQGFFSLNKVGLLYLLMPNLPIRRANDGTSDSCGFRCLQLVL